MLPRAAIVVEDRYSVLLKMTHAPAGFLPDLLARVQVRYPATPIVFLETRPLAEEWTFRWLGAALAESMAVGQAWGEDAWGEDAWGDDGAGAEADAETEAGAETEADAGAETQAHWDE